MQRVDTCPAGKSDQWCFDSVRFRPIGGVTVRTIHWINRPTFQQAVEIQGHRPRGYVRAQGRDAAARAARAAYKACASPNRQHGPPLAYRVVQPARAALGLPDGRLARRERPRGQLVRLR